MNIYTGENTVYTITRKKKSKTMARRKKLVLTEEHIALISNIKFEEFVFDDKEHYSVLKKLVSDLRLDKNHEKYNKEILDGIYDVDPHTRLGWGIDQWNMFGGTYVLEDVALILGYFDQAIENSETLAGGRRFPAELEEKMYDLYEYIRDNLSDILVLVLSYAGSGEVIKPGTYEYVDFRWVRKS